jgi:hypothetical protein
MRRQSQPEVIQSSASGLQMHKLSDLQPPQQKHKNKRKPLLIGQKMPKHVGYNRKVQEEH